ncbi:4-hydroxyphenylpyruvate dioxygenase [Fischerella thermalis]|uniref:4-hydroxyphenylpyruvate dioxygenase n=1 Tax=Fischerella thermalis TaxID=372787 RepID=UPI000C803DDA|nr:4-hydroxyphenylpyruvate dioxygenase [Fischerella thermalis]PLZ11046.1 4-hydroxyphenylpyruvate dioxygenase [Fischerella thermalis WC1110]PLZ42890.1 4-hydroxyphenylpyruvate dioxygenase [Fischerella thermalis WC538]PLZ43032.1 4-hydroxyphenylpyruvate dioxygenase [Fischerella thermalis WC527]
MKINWVHFYVEDAKAWRDWFVSHLGFQVVESSALLTPFINKNNGSCFHTCTEAVKSGSVCFLLSSPLLPISPVADFLHQHPPGVADVAFVIEDVEAAIARAQAYGAKILQPIQHYQQGDRYIKWSKIAAWGSLTHTLIEQWEDREKISLTTPPPHHPITAIDHIVLNVAVGDLERAVTWYEKILDFQPQQTFKIQTDYSSLYSQVMVSRHGDVQFPINEPASANSQIQEFLNVNRGPGIQHIALRTANIVSAIAQFRGCGLSLLPVPQSYYLQLKERLEFPLSSAELEAIAQQEILVDWNQKTPDALLLQIFTQPIFGQPTFFFEFIERRRQAQGFGEGNFQALFEAIEREQIKRGSLLEPKE